MTGMSGEYTSEERIRGLVTGSPEFDPEVVAATTRRQGGYIRLPADLTDALDEQAEHRVLGRSKLIEMILRQWLKNLSPGPSSVLRDPVHSFHIRRRVGDIPTIEEPIEVEDGS